MGLLSHTLIGCLLASLPGPPRIKFNNAYFALYPVDKINKYCPEVEPGRDIGFYLYSRKFPEKAVELRIGDDVTLSTSGLDLRLPTVIYFPPFFDGFDSMNVREVKQAYLQRGSHNFISIVAERLQAGPWYPTAVTNTLVVGLYAAVFIDYLISKGLRHDGLHFIGLSIGAHSAGIAGRFLKSGRPPRITGLDPASLLFLNKHVDMRLDKSDADLVDIIHTDGFFGTPFPIGHADFFVDADKHLQPGCTIRETLSRYQGILLTIFCSHLRANKLFAMSVLHPTAFPGFQCSSWKKSQSCHIKSIEFMGADVSPTARGIFYVPTTSKLEEMGNEIT